jgi:ubiquinone/menaquinone biosynthesis C-methylase UbiE
MKHKTINGSTKVLEVGCGYGGNLIPFLELGCSVTGIDIRTKSIDFAKEKFADYPKEKVELIAANFLEVNGLDNSFDIIFMKDTLEHIPNHYEVMFLLKRFLKDDGIIFQGFPPWYNPFGGHQQMCENKLLSRLPWFHLSPRFLYKRILSGFGERPSTVKSLLNNVYDCRITLQGFKRMTSRIQLTVLDQKLYFINPNYEVKFKLKPRTIPILLNIPYFRDFYITTSYFILGKTKK